jgi:glycosyltransferase involved in cell wall biosynthesis
VFVAAGRDIALKNKKGLHEAFAKLKQKYPDIELDERSLPPAEHAVRIAGCYGVVVASISEVNPNTAIEAAAARKPFIAPEDCGGKERLQSMGEFVDVTDTGALEAALEKLLEPDAYQSYVEASAVLRPHSWSDMAQEYATLFN